MQSTAEMWAIRDAGRGPRRRCTGRAANQLRLLNVDDALRCTEEPQRAPGRLKGNTGLLEIAGRVRAHARPLHRGPTKAAAVIQSRLHIDQMGIRDQCLDDLHDPRSHNADSRYRMMTATEGGGTLLLRGSTPPRNSGEQQHIIPAGPAASAPEVWADGTGANRPLLVGTTIHDVINGSLPIPKSSTACSPLPRRSSVGRFAASPSTFRSRNVPGSLD